MYFVRALRAAPVTDVYGQKVFLAVGDTCPIRDSDYPYYARQPDVFQAYSAPLPQERFARAKTGAPGTVTITVANTYYPLLAPTALNDPYGVFNADGTFVPLDGALRFELMGMLTVPANGTRTKIGAKIMQELDPGSGLFLMEIASAVLPATGGAGMASTFDLRVLQGTWPGYRGYARLEVTTDLAGDAVTLVPGAADNQGLGIKQKSI